MTITRSARTPRKRVPKRLAVIDADCCTGCEACVEICPVDCIELRSLDQAIKGTQAWCEIDWDRCIGCTLCVGLPQRKGEVYELLVCPWEAIEMVAPDQLPQAATRLGGPPEYAAAHRERLQSAAQRQADQWTASQG